MSKRQIYKHITPTKVCTDQSRLDTRIQETQTAQIVEVWCLYRAQRIDYIKDYTKTTDQISQKLGWAQNRPN